MRKLAVFTLVSLSTAVFGCAPGTYESDESEELTAEAEGAFVGDNALNPNALNPNALNPNALNPNALNPNALNPNALAPDALTAIHDSGTIGTLSRMHLKYLVSCAFTSEQSFDFTWYDAELHPHEESYVGSIGLAETWSAAPLGATEQRWVSACMAARTNFYATTVLISMRGDHSSLGTIGSEELAYSAREGAFWGNIFDSQAPYIHACFDPTNTTNSRAHLRDCAAGHLDNGDTVECGMIDIVGPCDTVVSESPFKLRCPTPANDHDGYGSCADESQVITVFLPPT